MERFSDKIMPKTNIWRAVFNHRLPPLCQFRAKTSGIGLALLRPTPGMCPVKTSV
jgi:hypothetical protein